MNESFNIEGTIFIIDNNVFIGNLIIEQTFLRTHALGTQPFSKIPNVDNSGLNSLSIE